MTTGGRLSIRYILNLILFTGILLVLITGDEATGGRRGRRGRRERGGGGKVERRGEGGVRRGRGRERGAGLQVPDVAGFSSLGATPSGGKANGDKKAKGKGRKRNRKKQNKKPSVFGVSLPEISLPDGLTSNIRNVKQSVKKKVKKVVKKVVKRIKSAEERLSDAALEVFGPRPWELNLGGPLLYR